MDTWPRIPRQQGGTVPARSGSGLPAPGTVIMASVEEDLGEGVYALRWAGNRISVTSRAILTPGQSLILKSETSSEGKPTLVVQGPALPNPGSISGRVIYGPGQRGGQSTTAASASGQAGQPIGSEVAAGVAKAAPLPLAQPVASLLGLILEPLPDLDEGIQYLIDQAEEERKKWQADAGAKQTGSKDENAKETDGEQVDAGENRDRAQAVQQPSGRDILLDAGRTETRPAVQGDIRPLPASAQVRIPAVDIDPAPRLPNIPDPPVTERPPDAGAEARKEQGADRAATAPAAPASSQPATNPSRQSPEFQAQQPESAIPPASVRPASPPVMQPGDSPTPQTVGTGPAEPPSVSLPGRDAPFSQSEVRSFTPAETVSPQTPSTSGETVSGQTAPPVGRPAVLPPGTPLVEGGPLVPEVVVPEATRPLSPAPISPPAAPPVSVPSATVAVPENSTAMREPAAVPEPPVPAQSATVTPPDSSGAAHTPFPSSPSNQPGDGVSVQPQMPEVRPPLSPAPSATAPPPATIPANDGQTAPNIPQADVQPPTRHPPPAVAPTPPAVTEMPKPGNETPPAAGSPSASAQTVSPSPPQALPPDSGSTPPASLSPRPVEAPAAPSEAVNPQENRNAPETAAQTPPPRPSGQPPEISSEILDPAKAEAFIKEALTQVVKAAELPLASSSANGQSLGVGGKMPEAIVDKAAGILLRAAGLTPDSASMEAARALVDNNVQVDRQTVQAMLAITAGAPEEDREALLKAAARLSAKDVPLATPLASGLASVIERRAGAYELMDKASAALAAGVEVEAAKPLLAAARELLDLLHVDLGQNDASSALERYLSTFGREALGKALAMVEKATQAVLEGHPLLPKIDASLAAILRLIERDIAAVEGGETASAGRPGEASPRPVPGKGEAAQSLDSGAATVPADAKESDASALPLGKPAVDAPRAPQQSPINAYLRAPKPFPGLEALNLPPMPKVVSLQNPGPSSPAIPLPGQPAPSDAPSTGESMPSIPNAQVPDTGMARPGTTPEVAAEVVSPKPGSVPASPDGAPSPQPAASVPEAAAKLAEQMARAPDRQSAVDLAADKARIIDGETAQPETREPAERMQQVRDAVLRKLESIFQTPGLNRPEFELLKPSGILDRFLNAPPDPATSEKARASAGQLVKDLLADDPEKTRQTLRDLPRQSPAALKETAARLSRMEAELVRSEPVLNRLADAANSLRDLGRQLLAVKAENVAGQERDPGVMLAEVPFKLNEDGGNGRMQMFYRRGKGKQGGWTSRVILDLNTTSMGPVLGDMRFFGQDMVLNMFVEKPETATFLGESAEQLAEGLEKKGFRVKTRFMVLPPPPPPPEIKAERPEITGESDETVPEHHEGGTSRRGRLDVKG